MSFSLFYLWWCVHCQLHFNYKSFNVYWCVKFTLLQKTPNAFSGWLTATISHAWLINNALIVFLCRLQYLYWSTQYSSKAFHYLSLCTGNWTNKKDLVSYTVETGRIARFLFFILKKSPRQNRIYLLSCTSKIQRISRESTIVYFMRRKFVICVSTVWRFVIFSRHCVPFSWTFSVVGIFVFRRRRICQFHISTTVPEPAIFSRLLNVAAAISRLTLYNIRCLFYIL